MESKCGARMGSKCWFSWFSEDKAEFHLVIRCCRCFVNQTSKLIRLPCCSRKMMVASKRHEDLYWFRPEPYVQSQR
jgi:hypothetical protein